jgi:hypothetical protein
MTRIWFMALLATVACVPSAQSPVNDTPVNTTGEALAAGNVEISKILSTPQYVGRTVTTNGKCIGYSTRVAEGPPPRTRSDWQLEDSGVGIWVVGAFPAGCTGAEGDGRRISVRALVAEDTVQLLAPASRKSRRYLVAR